VLVATDIAARGIDVDALGHVVNFDVPLVPEDYIHRVGRTGRAEATGEAFTFMAPDERGPMAAIERAVGRKLPQVTVPDFDYRAKPTARLEIPLAERIAEIRARKAQERARAEAKRQRQAMGGGAGAGRGRGGSSGGGAHHGSGGRPGSGGSSAGGGRPHGPSGDRPRQPGSGGRKWSFRPRRGR
jgi:ATP-dependent RNA helicase RhlE